MKNNIKLEKVDGVNIIKSKDTLYKIEVDLNKTTMANVMRLFNPEEIQDITISSTPLEEIIKDIYKKEGK
jgi:ABC-type uncharacterized transport system ATPase subunit